ncbi:D-alanine--D-alanine ligase [Nocardia sp. XZ_19_369]|uniref:D-alanine--D-alanine ligase n=1 Tax=Nocardia sp. XZ_19_369 TaxID=2769487 RepID=UPI0018902850|nr:D-alanine--D-alanine ligase [Nocardia sp. XZ_19_369]
MRVAVLLGGTASERDVSITTAGQVFRALRDRGHEVMAFDTTAGRLGPEQEQALLVAQISENEPDRATIPSRDRTMQLVMDPDGLRAADVVFLALHGGTGENGTIQGLLDIAGIPYTGSGLLASAVAMNKNISKQLFRTAGILTPDWFIADPTDAGFDSDRLGFPVVVKPSSEGSSIGLTVVKEPADFEDAVKTARGYDDEVMVEQFVPGREFVVGVLEDQPLAVGEIIPRSTDVFDYTDKYQAGGAQKIFPADLPPDQAEEMHRLALAAHTTLKLKSYSRSDFRMDIAGNIWCLEANSLPGMTSTSLLPRSAAAVGIGFAELCERICLDAMR